MKIGSYLRRLFFLHFMAIKKLHLLYTENGSLTYIKHITEIQRFVEKTGIDYELVKGDNPIELWLETEDSMTKLKGYISVKSMLEKIIENNLFNT